MPLNPLPHGPKRQNLIGKAEFSQKLLFRSWLVCCNNFHNSPYSHPYRRPWAKFNSGKISYVQRAFLIHRWEILGMKQA